MSYLVLHSKIHYSPLRNAANILWILPTKKSSHLLTIFLGIVRGEMSNRLDKYKEILFSNSIARISTSLISNSVWILNV